MHPEDALLNLRARRVRSGRRPDGVARLDIRGEGKGAEVLEELDEEEGHLVVGELDEVEISTASDKSMTRQRITYLLTEAYTRTRVEGNEDVRAMREVLAEALVDEAVGVKLAR